MVTAFLFQNLIELITYSQLSNGIEPLYLLKAYYVALLVLLVSILGFVCEQGGKWQRVLTYGYSGIALLFVILVLFTDRLVGGYVHDSFPIIAVKGDGFSLYLIFALSCIVVSILIILRNIAKSTSKESIDKNRYNLLALSPFFFIAMFIGFGMLMRFQVNGSALFPIASTLFMAVTVIFRCTPHYKIARNIPLSRANRLSKAAGLCALEGVHSSEGLKRALEGHEALVLNYAIQTMGKNKSELASHLKIDRRTLDRKLKKYNLWWHG